MPLEYVRQEATGSPLTIYAASKIEGERAAWAWVKENKPHFIFNSVLPNLSVSDHNFRQQMTYSSSVVISHSAFRSSLTTTFTTRKQIGRVLHPEIYGSSGRAVAELVNGKAQILQAGPGEPFPLLSNIL